MIDTNRQLEYHINEDNCFTSVYAAYAVERVCRKKDHD